MRKPVVILVAALTLGAVLFAGAFYCARQICVQRVARSTDDLDWLRMEFHLGDAELARIRALHEGYLPMCAENCEQIASKKHELAQAVAASTNATATLDRLRAEVAAARAHCQGEMLAHFEEVSHAMPSEQGERYLAEMKRLHLDKHEQVEQSMSGTNGHMHDHH
jgi:hypothetical protein